MPKKTSNISDTKMVEIVVKRLTGKTQAEIAKEFGVSEQTIQYYEAKESSQELKSIVLRRIAEGVGDALAQTMLAKLKLGQPPENDDEDDSEEFHFVQEKLGD